MKEAGKLLRGQLLHLRANQVGARFDRSCIFIPTCLSSSPWKRLILATFCDNFRLQYLHTLLRLVNRTLALDTTSVSTLTHSIANTSALHAAWLPHWYVLHFLNCDRNSVGTCLVARRWKSIHDHSVVYFSSLVLPTGAVHPPLTISLGSYSVTYRRGNIEFQHNRDGLTVDMDARIESATCRTRPTVPRSRRRLHLRYASRWSMPQGGYESWCSGSFA